jgi:hypothetical protein
MKFKTLALVTTLTLATLVGTAPATVAQEIDHNNQPQTTRTEIENTKAADRTCWWGWCDY